MHRLARAFTLRQAIAHLNKVCHPSQHLVSPRIQCRARSQLLYRTNGEPVRYQTVRFKKPGIFSLRRIATFGIYTGVAYTYLHLLLRYMDIGFEIVTEEEPERQLPAETGRDVTDVGEETEVGEEGSFYAEEDSLFIPLTWSRELPRTFYRGSDPEWQEFVKIARDKPRHKKIQEELLQIVHAGSVQHPSIARQLGQDTKIGKYWLDIAFPDGPPPEWERSGIEIGDDFIAWSQQKVSQENQWRLMRALWPKATAESSWVTLKVLGGIQYRRVKQALGWEGTDPSSPEEQYRHLMDMMEKRQQARHGKTVGKAQTDPEGTSTSILGTSSDASDSGQQRKLPWHMQLLEPTSNKVASTDLPIAMHVFSATLSKQWKPKKMEPPRGAFIVHGLVEVRGSKARVLLDVRSSYDPKAGKYVQVDAGVRNFKRWNQAPRGGP